MKYLLLSCVILGLTACGGSGDGGSSSNSSSSSNQVSSSSSSSSSFDPECPQGKHIVGYFPSWQGDVQDIQYQYLTHIMYSFVLPNDDGRLQPLDEESIAELGDLVLLAHGQGVKVGIALGGWNDGDDSAFVELAANSATRTAFVNNITDFVVQHNLDGVDMDWEYPSSNEEAEDYTALMTELRAALDELSGEKFLTAAVIAQGDWNGQYIQSTVFDQVDFLNIMAYDEYQAVNHSTIAYATTSIDYWENRGLSREKTVLGVPFYARPSWATYSSYVAADPANACTDSVGDNYYNGIPTIRVKSELASDRVCGMMMWELSQDTRDETSLLKAIWEVVNGQEPSYICD